MTKGECVGKFWFSEAMPQEVKDASLPLLVENEHLIPEWCHEVRVYWNPAGEHVGEDLAAAYIETEYAYRYATLTICPAFLSEEDEARTFRIKHELWHIVSSPLVSYLKDITDILSKRDELLSEIVARESTEKVESLTEDLTNILIKIEEKQSKNKK